MKVVILAQTFNFLTLRRQWPARIIWQDRLSNQPPHNIIFKPTGIFRYVVKMSRSYLNFFLTKLIVMVLVSD